MQIAVWVAFVMIPGTESDQKWGNSHEYFLKKEAKCPRQGSVKVIGASVLTMTLSLNRGAGESHDGVIGKNDDIS